MNAPTNELRGQWAMEAVEAFSRAVYSKTVEEDLVTQITDLVADLRHLCRVNEIDWGYVERAAATHYSAERAEELTEETADCDACGGVGMIMIDDEKRGGEIQRCDACGTFEGDEGAQEFALECVQTVMRERC